MPNQPSKPLQPQSSPENMLAGVRSIPVLPVRDTVLFPHAVLPLTVGRESSIQLIESLGEERTIVVAAQLDPRLDAPKPPICTQWARWPRCTRLCACPTRAALSSPRAWSGCGWCAISQTEPFMVAEVETLEDVEPAPPPASRRWCAMSSGSSSRLSPSRRRSLTSCGRLPRTLRSRAGWWILSPPRCPS